MHLITPLPPEDISPPSTPTGTYQRDGVVVSLLVKPSRNYIRDEYSYIHSESQSSKYVHLLPRYVILHNPSLSLKGSSCHSEKKNACQFKC